MAKTNFNLSVEEVMNLIKLGEFDTVDKIWKDKLVKFELNLVHNHYTYKELRYFLDYLMLPKLCEDTMPKEECVKETINLIDYFTFDSWTKSKAAEIITKRINIISAEIYIGLLTDNDNKI